MARTRACKARPRLPCRNAIGRVTSKRGSTVESLRASVTSTEEDASALQIKQQAPGTRGYMHASDKENGNAVKIKQEDDDTTEPSESRTWPKRRAQEPTPKVSPAKKHKPPPPVYATRITRSKTLPRRNERRSIQSDSESESDIETHRHTKTPSMNSPLHLLRPYMAFQLSVSGLSGKAYKAAEASMKSVLDVAENFEKECSSALARTQDSLSSNSSEESAEHKPQSRPKQGVKKKLCKIDKLASETEEDVLPRKQRELHEQTRTRLAKERRARHNQRRKRASSNQSSSSSPSSEAATDLASDTEDEAKYPPNTHLSISTTTSFYDSRRASTTDSTETSSEGEESDMIERREKNVLRWRKAKQKRRNAYKRKEEGTESESEPETDVGVVVRKREEKKEIGIPVLIDRDCGKEVKVDFCPIAW